MKGVPPRVSGDIRVAAWNLARANANKLERSRSLDADILIVSEITDQVAGAWASLHGLSCEWVGDHGRQGLAVFGSNGWKLEPGTTPSALRLFLPVRAVRDNLSISVLGACVKAQPSGYAAMLSAAVTHLVPRSADRLVLAGDFNLTAALDQRRPASRRFGPVLRRMEEVGLRSCWHENRGEAHGREGRATYFHHWRDSDATRFHIDYVFASSDLGVRAAWIGDADEVLGPRTSDHSPVLADLNLRS